MEVGGGSAGVKDLTEDGGGPAGVVDGVAVRPLAKKIFRCSFVPGVEGPMGLDERGTVQPDMTAILRLLF